MFLFPSFRLDASWHTANCPLHMKLNRGRPSSPEGQCKCSTQPLDPLSPQNVLLLLSLMAKPRPQLFLQHISTLTKVVAFAAVSQDNGGVLDGNTLSYTIEIIESFCLYVAAEGSSRLRYVGALLVHDKLLIHRFFFLIVPLLRF